MSVKIKNLLKKVFITLVIVSAILIIVNMKTRRILLNDRDKINYEIIKQNVGKRVDDNVDQNKQYVASNNLMKYILIWTSHKTYPFIYLQNGQKSFETEHCEYTNCFVTDDKSYFSDVRKFDALLFHVPEYVWVSNSRGFGAPQARDPRQKYIISCIESADNYPTCDPRHNNYFNWTWTYKLTSDVMWGYMGIRDLETGKIVGPKVDMQWRENMVDVTEGKKNELRKKTKAVAWFVSNCHTKSRREDFAKKLAASLNKYGLQIDIYGKCGTMTCERDSKVCFDKMKNDYFFYLAFENSITEDYITEKFVNSMKYGVVPIVWGGADYSRFAPPGSYINAREINDADIVAKIIHSLMNDIDEYAKYFRWTRYYSYQRDIETNETQAFCNLCKALNDPEKMAKHSTYSDLKTWWNGNTKNYC